MENELSVELSLNTEQYKSDLAGALKEFNKFQKELSSKRLFINNNQRKEFDSIFTDIKNTAIRELNTVQKRINDLDINSDKIMASWDRAIKNLDTSLPTDKFNERLSKIDEIEVKFNMNEEALKDAEDRYQGLMEVLQENPLEMQYNDDAFVKFNTQLDNVADGLTKSGQKMDEVKKKASGLAGIFSRWSIAGRVISQMKTSISTMLNPLNYVRRLWNDIIMADGSNLGNTFRTVGENLKNYLTPILQKVATAILNVISYLAQMLSIITGKKIDLFKKSKESTDKIKKNMAGTAKSAKQVNRQLASGFDEITDISESVSGGGGGGGADLSPITQPIDFKFNEPKLPKVLENIAKWIKNNPKWSKILAGLTTFTILGGWKKASGLVDFVKSIIGKGGSKDGSGATGLLGLKNVLALAAIVWTIKLTWEGFDLFGHHISGVKEFVTEFKELNKAQKHRDELNDSVIESNQRVYNSQLDILKSETATDDQRKKAINGIRILNKGELELAQTTAGGSINQMKHAKELMNSAAKMDELYKAGKLTKDEEYEYFKMLNNELNPTLEKSAGWAIGNKEANDELRTSYEKLAKKYRTEYMIEVKNTGFDALKTALDKIKTGLKGIFDSTGLTKLFNNLGIGDKITNVKNTLSGLANSFGSKVKQYIPSLDIGTNYVPNDTLALVHEGEAIIPKEYNNYRYNPSYLGSQQTNELLKSLISAVNNIDINPYTTVKDIGSTAVQYIKDKERQMGRSVV